MVSKKLLSLGLGVTVAGWPNLGRHTGTQIQPYKNIRERENVQS